MREIRTYGSEKGLTGETQWVYLPEKREKSSLHDKNVVCHPERSEGSLAETIILLEFQLYLRCDPFGK
jgi:hypothetical protein